MINIITPCIRPENLILINNSINIPKKEYRWIVIFDMDEFSDKSIIPENCEYYFHRNKGSVVGNSQRNFGLDLVKEGYVYFNDDDTTINPYLWDNIKDLKNDFISFDQKWNIPNIVSIRLTGNDIMVGNVDSHNFLTTIENIGNTRLLIDQYVSDGIFAEECFKKSKNSIYIHKCLSAYNTLDNSRIYQVNHIYNEPQFGEKWFNYENFYKRMVEKFPNGSSFLEIGSWKGMSSAYMCIEIINSRKNIQFYCLDTWEGSVEHRINGIDTSNLFELFLNNMIPVRNYYKALRTTSLLGSLQFEDESLDFVFIDASHEYEDVKQDISIWLPKVKHGGILSGHDYGNPDFPGVEKAVKENFKVFEIDGPCWIYNK